jgi:predicted acylesterase/phospholipase RssA
VPGNAYRILSLDGGGPWTVIQARALGRLFGANTKGREILARFDLVAGTSGGSVITAALACDFTPAEIFGLLNTERIRRSFFQDTWYAGFTRMLGLGPRYRGDKKIAGMRSFLDPAVLGRTLAGLPASLGIATQFLITAFDYDKQRAVYFRSNTASLAASPPSIMPSVTLEQAVHASSQAPINYFDAPAVFEVAAGADGESRRYWDGALTGADNPVFAAVIEALANGQPRERIQALSIGCGSAMLPVEDDDIHPPWARHLPSRGFAQDLRK